MKNILIMTDKYNCSQIQAIIQSFDKVVRHTCTVVFCKLMLGHLWRVEKETSEREQTWKFNIEIFTPVDVKMI